MKLWRKILTHIPYNFEIIKVFLKNHGYNTEEIKQADNKKIIELYEEYNIKAIYEFQIFLNQNNALSSTENIKKYHMQDELNQKILKINGDISKIYDLIDIYFDDYDHDELLEILCKRIKNFSINKIQKIFQIKYRQYQEIWLKKLEIRFKDLPAEEKIFLKKYYEKNRNNMEKLKYVYEYSKNPQYIEKIKKVAQIKLDIMENFMPDLKESYYKSYYNNTPEKIKLIKEISQLNPSYSKNQLKEFTITELKSLNSEILEQNKKEIQDKKLFHKYTNAISQSMDSMDDESFVKICLEAIRELDEEQLQKVVNFSISRNKFFLGKFNTVIKEHQGLTKIRFI
ncbi:hypothetical protein [Helicobacter sp. 13S00477-4]|uniref:hypothetical protein n=1 Tax=Helicobacter sp. 13S00477-4 TaxID=1905759 RepID=UPI000BA52F5B|nr:hypothetical protein [Helicobacter sp. 13S00477-4]PAF52637.1 hypothetical protein BKH44_00145 [Helicobacter sp. 13S00477-4]